ncbi:MAG: PAS domain S-box-containing protein [Candidatus Azotimanducaceae bacterium]|jgi:PAS domain S-box-containing protein
MFPVNIAFAGGLETQMVPSELGSDDTDLIPSVANEASEKQRLRLADQRHVIFDRLSTENGLSQAVATSVVQDQSGFMWIGTQEGLNRYDGYTFETFFHTDGNPRSLSHDTVWDLLVDSEGSLWVGTDSGLNKFNEVSGDFDFIDVDADAGLGASHSVVYSLYEDSKGQIWIGTGSGLILMNTEGQLTHYHHSDQDGTSIGGGSIRSVLEDSHNRLWVGTEFGGVNLFDPETEQFIRYTHDPSNDKSISDNYIRFILEADDGKLWLATFDGGISIFDPETEQAHRVFGTSSSRVRTLLKDDNGDIWAGTNGGLNLWRPKTQSFDVFSQDPTDVHSMSDNNVIELYQDEGGVIWVGTFNGLSKWNAQTEIFPHIRQNATRKVNLTSNSITSFAETTDNNVWIGTFEGLNRWNSKLGEFDDLSRVSVELTDDLVMSLLEKDGVLWVGTMAGGVNLIKNDRVIGQFEYDEKDPQSLSSNAVSRLYVDSQDRMWLTTYGGGVNLYLGEGKFRRYPIKDNPKGAFRDKRTLDIVEGPDGLFWIATDGGGVMLLDAESGDTKALVHKAGDLTSLSSDNVISILYADGIMWVGTRDRGMNRYNPETGDFKRISKIDGLSSDAVYGMMEDGQGEIWTSGGKGLSVLNSETGEFSSYDSTHGLQSDDFNSGAYLKLSDGTFLFGGSNGFNAFDPDKIKGNTYVPPIRLTRFSKFNEVQRLQQPIYKSEVVDLAYNDFVIGFEFSALDYTAPEKNKYRYMLEGFDRDWVDANDTRQVTYTNLDSGEYVFRVIGSNNDKVWNEEGATIKVVVSPPLWATWWAYLLYALLCVIFFNQAQKANQARLRREAEKRYSERLQLYIESLEEATDCVLIADANKNLMYANNAISSILGMTPSQAVGRSILSLLFSDQADANLARKGLQSEGRWHGEVTSARGMDMITTEVTIAAVHDNSDNESAYVSITRDITDRKQTESELENHRRNLEFLVAERTKALEREIAENKAVQVELADSLKEKELLLKEVHHRVKNNMQVISSLLNIQAETHGNEVFATLLGESQQRIKSMSLIHENLYQSDNLLEIDFEDYINMLANSLCRFYSIPGVSVSLDIQVDNVALDIETAVPCGLIINELISNSLKHAFKGREGRGTIFVTFKKVNCRYVLEIGDDGVGLPEGFEPSDSSSMGMEIVSILTQQLDGRLKVQGTNGARFEISFPRKDKYVN